MLATNCRAFTAFSTFRTWPVAVDWPLRGPRIASLRAPSFWTVISSLRTIGAIGSSYTTIAAAVIIAAICTVRAVTKFTIAVVVLAVVIVPVTAVWPVDGVIATAVGAVAIVITVVVVIPARIARYNGAWARTVHIIIPVVTSVASVIIVYNERIVSVTVVAVSAIHRRTIRGAVVRRRAPPSTMPVIPWAISEAYVKPSGIIVESH